MADNSSDLTIFRLPGSPSQRETIENFRDFPELAAPVVPVRTGAFAFYTIPVRADKGLSVMPVFTDPRLTVPPLFANQTPAFLQTLFNAPAADVFAFNSPDPRTASPAGEVRLDKRRISAVIGFLQTPDPLPSGTLLETVLKTEAGLGNLHRANYIASALIAADPSRPCGPYAETLIDLGLLQDAHDYVKTFQTPEFFYYRALILRLSGEAAKARQWLDKIPPGSPCEDKKRVESAWLLLEEGRTDEALKAFRPLAETSFEKTAALFGVGAALMKRASAGRDQTDINDSLTAFAKALTIPSPLLPKIVFYMGSMYFRTGKRVEAEACYRKAAVLWPAVQSKANLALALLKNGKFQEAASLINDIALTDLNSAGRLAAELPGDSAVKLLEATRQHRTASPAPRPRPAAKTPAQRPQNPAQPEPSPAIPSQAQELPQETREAMVVVSLEAASPRISDHNTPPKKTDPKPPASAEKPARPAPELQMESLMDTASAAPITTEETTRKDDFMGRAFKLASALEDEFNKKIYFNAEGLTEVERKLRLTFIKARQNPQEAIETVKDCSAFLCFLLQERHKGRLVKMTDFDHWGWPVVFDSPKHMVTYPIQRTWQLLWQETIPEPGWLIKYLQYIEEELRSGHVDKPAGVAAVQGKVPSHPERIIDVQTEHRRIMILVSTLEETSYIELGRSGIVKLETALRAKFKPDIPPTADGWKLLRCYGHIMAEILSKDFKAAWYNTEGNDGLWSMQLPWKTFIFPIGKVYKAASNRESLSEYYDALLAEKLRVENGTIA